MLNTVVTINLENLTSVVPVRIVLAPMFPFVKPEVRIEVTETELIPEVPYLHNNDAKISYLNSWYGTKSNLVSVIVFIYI